MAKHIGIVGVSAEGAALCYRAICVEGAALMGPHAHPEVSMHTLCNLAATGRRLRAGCTSPRRTASSGPLASRRWKTKSSSRLW